MERDKLLEYLEIAQAKGRSVEELFAYFKLENSQDMVSLMKLLNQLEEERYVARNRQDRYCLSELLGYVTAKIRVNPKGFGFIDLDTESVYIAKEHLHYAMNHDLVYAKTWADAKGISGEVIQIVEHGVQRIIGVIKKKQGHVYFLSDEALQRQIVITNYDEYALENDTKVEVTIDSYGPKLKGHITRILGYKYDSGIDVLSLLLTKGIEPDFPNTVLDEANQFSDDFSDEYAKRRDLRSLLTITIDGDDAKDLDDAISIEKIPEGYRLYVHIADVSHYVQEGSALDLEAYQRGTSVYVVDRVVPMLPPVLSNGLCSLHPQVERLTLTCMMDFDKQGNQIGYEIFPSIIVSNERMTYRNVNAIMEGNRRLQKQYEHLMPMFAYMSLLAEKLQRKREEAGSIDFDAKEAKILVDDRGIPQDIVLRERGAAERLIESFMIAANECVAAHMKWNEIPSMYRVHEQPDPRKMKQFAFISRILGYPFTGGLQNVYPKQLADMLNAAKDDPNYFVLSRFMLRSMAKARYDVNCLGHFGLGLNEYLHFTSPIRRYPDLVVHRMLHRYCFEGCINPSKMQEDSTWIESAAMHASERERNAVEAERNVDDMKKAQYMGQFVGHRFHGIVSGVTRFGMFVELENTVEGLVHIQSMDEDYFYYDENTCALYGEFTGMKYQMGDKVTIKVVGANRYERQIDFELVKKARKRKKGKR